MKILVNHNSAIPLYLQIEEQLRTIIKGEEYKQGKMLPNEIDLSNLHRIKWDSKTVGSLLPTNIEH